MTREFEHYPGCGGHDTANCQACALTDTRQARPNYAGWPLAYMENNRAIPVKWKKAFQRELARTDNPSYVKNLQNKLIEYGAEFTDGTFWFEAPTGRVIEAKGP